nr:uncharacterized protein LOC109159587 [Ipomoea batatas]
MEGDRENWMMMTMSNSIACPKPGRVGGLVDELTRPSCLQPFSQQTEACDSEAGIELLEIILSKGGCHVGTPNLQMASSPPFFSGSPPSRAMNPLIQDLHFGHDDFVAVPSPLRTVVLPLPSPPLTPSSTRMNGGGCGMRFGQKPAQVRIEGFNCRQNYSIPAVS